MPTSLQATSAIELRCGRKSMVLDAAPVETTLSADLVARSWKLLARPVPAEVMHVARHCLLDWTGVTLAGAHEPVVDCHMETLDRGGFGSASLIGRNERLALLDAVTVNGAASHVLDFDDSQSAMGGHESLAIMTALISLHEVLDRDGGCFLRSMIAGHQMAGLLGETLGSDSYQRSFHSTATIGAMAVAVACAQSMQLDERQALTALSIAASQAAGLKAMFGTMGKPFQGGRAASAGLLAARLDEREPV